ncbi:RNA polymerase II subunit A C-terminal domain phosphatase SSU72 [Varanus komodoensis]|nr:RNA polymerase II subunit A C-terminal domain phosphatase SSU72 [Varanus komodoensis]
MSRQAKRQMEVPLGCLLRAPGKEQPSVNFLLSFSPANPLGTISANKSSAQGSQKPHLLQTNAETYLNSREQETCQPVHVINVDIQDNHEEATLGAFLICELCQCVSTAFSSCHTLSGGPGAQSSAEVET